MQDKNKHADEVQCALMNSNLPVLPPFRDPKQHRDCHIVLQCPKQFYHSV